MVTVISIVCTVLVISSESKTFRDSYRQKNRSTINTVPIQNLPGKPKCHTNTHIDVRLTDKLKILQVYSYMATDIIEHEYTYYMKVGCYVFSNILKTPSIKVFKT